MTRSRHVALERSATAIVRGRSTAERRAALEEDLALALAVGDRVRVSEVRAVLETLPQGRQGRRHPSGTMGGAHE